jgi:CubicO group peptidase (beta-lactamase class C family)
MTAQSLINRQRPAITGFCHDRFAPVKEAFERNFREHDEVGAAVAIYLDGEPVVDLWNGIADLDTGASWDRETALTIFSAGKGLAAACLHVLIDRGLLDLDAPIARYWPEFAANGKNEATVALAMSHQLGLPLWQSEVPPGGLLDWDLATRMLAQEPLIWEPGTAHGYHGIAIGFLWGSSSAGSPE